jgi:hypothetical protein
MAKKGRLYCRQLLLFFSYGSEIGVAADRDAMFLSILGFIPSSNALPGRRIDRHHVAEVDRRIFLNAAALRVSLGRANMLPYAVDSFNHDAFAARQHAENPAGLTFVSSGNHHHLVA